MVGMGIGGGLLGASRGPELIAELIGEVQRAWMPWWAAGTKHKHWGLTRVGVWARGGRRYLS